MNYLGVSRRFPIGGHKRAKLESRSVLSLQMLSYN